MNEKESLPESIGKYKIEDVLGKGAMGIVFRGFDPFIKREVAIKLIHKDLMSSSSGEEVSIRFRLEAQAAGRFSSHANIVTVYEYGEEEGCPYIVMEYVQGKTLKAWLDGNTHFTLQNACNIMYQLLNALHYSHSNNVVHRDIKPENLFLLQSGQIKISDFGIAKIDKTSVTQHGMRIGTPSFMSPEQIEGKPVDGRSDLFSAAVIFYQLLTDRKPFAGESLASLMHQVVNTEPDSVFELNRSLPKTFDGLMRKALAKNPDDRFQTGQEFAMAIKAALEGKSVLPKERKGTGPAARYAAIGAVVVLLLAGGGYWFMAKDVPVDQAGSGVSRDAELGKIQGTEEKTVNRDPAVPGNRVDQAPPEKATVITESVATPPQGGVSAQKEEDGTLVTLLPSSGPPPERAVDKPVTAGKAIKEEGIVVPVFDTRIFFTSTDGVMNELKNGDKLTPADTYYISFKAEDEVNLYVAQIDSQGDIYPIFPNAQFSREKNPLVSGREYKFPEENNLFLDFNTGKEQIFFVAGATQNTDIDGIFSEINAANETRKKELAKKFVTIFEKIDPAYTRSIWFWHK
ncbi:MAG: protein kinase [Pseudomonadota bacterium]